MTLGEIRIQFLRPHDLVKLFKGKDLVYSGFAFLIPSMFKKDRLEGMRMEIEIRRKDWREAGTWAPMHPEASAEVELSDVEIWLYYRLTLAA